MRCISKYDRFRHGIPALQSGDVYYVCRDFYPSIAFVTAASFQEMLSRGHAIDEPLQVVKTSSFMGETSDILGGPTIFRCDFEITDGAVWLIPQKPENKDSQDLLVFTHEYWEPDQGETRLTPGAQFITEVKGQFDDRFKLLKLSPGSGVQVDRTVRRKVPPHGWAVLNPLSSPRYENRIETRNLLFLAENGILQY